MAIIKGDVPQQWKDDFKKITQRNYQSEAERLRYLIKQDIEQNLNNYNG